MPRARTTGRKSNDARQVLVRLNAAEFAAIEKAAKGQPLGAWARAVLLRWVRLRERAPVEDTGGTGGE